jgi:hypothetical protein
MSTTVLVFPSYLLKYSSYLEEIWNWRLLQRSLVSLELHPNRMNLNSILFKDIIGFYIFSQKLFYISRQNLILETFSVFSYCNVNFSLIDLNQSLVHMKKFRNFFILTLFLGFIRDRWSWNSKGPYISHVLVSRFTWQQNNANTLRPRSKKL